MTGLETSPPTTFAKAPSIPAQTMTTAAWASLGKFRGRLQNTVNARNSDVKVPCSPQSHQLTGYGGLLGYWDIRSSGGYYGNGLPILPGSLSRPD